MNLNREIDARALTDTRLPSEDHAGATCCGCAQRGSDSIIIAGTHKDGRREVCDQIANVRKIDDPSIVDNFVDWSAMLAPLCCKGLPAMICLRPHRRG